MLPSTAETSEPTHIDGATGSVFSGLPSADGSMSGLRLPETCANRNRSWIEQVRSRLAESPTLSSAQVLFRIAGLAFMIASAQSFAGFDPEVVAARFDAVVRRSRRPRGSKPFRAANELYAGARNCALHHLPLSRDSSVKFCPNPPRRMDAPQTEELPRGRTPTRGLENLS